MKLKTYFPRLGMLALGLLLSISVMAQRGQRSQMTPAQREARMAEQYTKKLNLTSAQTTQLKSIASHTVQAMQQLRTDTSLNRQQRTAKMQALRQQREKDVRAILTTEQQQQYDAWQEKRDARQAQHKAARQGKKSGR